MSSYRVRRPKQRYINLLEFYPHYKFIALFAKAAIQADQSGELASYKDYVNSIFNMQPSDVTAMIIDDIEEAFRICRQTIIKQQLNNQANTILLSLLDELGIKYELSDKKAV